MAYRGLTRNLGILDYFRDSEGHKYRNYFMRFRAAFATEEEFVNCFPDDIQNIASEYYPILVEAFPNLLLKYNTKRSAQANLKFLVRWNSEKFHRYTELKKIAMPEMFNNDVVQKLDSSQESNATQKDQSNQNTSSTSNNANVKFNNEFIGDKESPIDDSKWKAEKNLQDGNTNDVKNLTQASNNTDTNSKAEQHSKSEKLDIQYKVSDIGKLLDMVQEPNAWLMKQILLQMAAPVMIDFEHYDDFRGDFRK